MKIMFNKEIGEIASILHSLYYACNINELLDRLKAENIVIDEAIEKDFQVINNSKKLLREELDFFFNSESHIWKSLIHTKKMWNYSTIDDFLDSIYDLSSIEIRERLFIKLNKEKSEVDYNEINDVIKNDKGFINYIKRLNVSSGTKWGLYCFTQDIDDYTNKFVEFIKKYIPLYNKVFEKHRIENESFNKYIEKRINEEGMDFIRLITKKYFNVENFKEIYVTTSFYNTYNINFAIEENSLYIYIGTKYIETLNRHIRENRIEENILVYKNLSDKTRFEIMKFLLTGEYFGQEIANKFGISTAAVSYQMNYLFAANLIHIEKKDRKVYYALNKETLSNSIDFLKEEFAL
ncbi:metalloregulator ArsR/SmtB family transcription factor [Wukongibacter baidiensis]|uniref:ArsR/SmtB family transcription factor n=1 Tax=Wukongibacter baidiensis TaxID=1723361 RepID=UPI003D7FF974